MTRRITTPRASFSPSLARSSSETSSIPTPSHPHSTLPFSTSWGRRDFTRFTGIANPMEPFRAAMLLTPTTSPAMFTRGPPELPGFTEASVWMKSNPGAATRRGAPLRLTIPKETVCSSPKGWPRARTNSPTRRRLESPSGRTGSPRAPSIFTRARSTRVSLPISVPSKRRPSCRRTWMRVASAMTWAFVTRSPSSRIRNPEPDVRRGSSGGPGSCPSPAGGWARWTRTWTSPRFRRSAS